MIQAVLLDMDGLMFGTEQLYVDGFQAGGRQLGIEVTDGLLARLRGTGIAQCRRIFNDAIPGQLYDRCRELCLEYVQDRLEREGVPVKPGLHTLLGWLRERQIPAVLATSTARDKAMAMLESAGVKEFFADFTFGTEVAQPKPAPDIFLAAAACVGAAPENCVVLEDSRNGLTAAKAAGCTAIVVPDLDPAPDAALGLWDHQARTLADVIPILEAML